MGRCLGLCLLLFWTASASSAATTGQLHALAVFARFADEGVDLAAPAFGGDLFDPQRPGSVSHFYQEMSRGQFRLTGDVQPRWYVSREPASAYLGSDGLGLGGFVTEILQQVDAHVDWGRYDSDGPDGVPNSGDDDGYVDYLFILTQSVPQGFLSGSATGVAELGLPWPFVTGDAATGGGSIRIRGDNDGVGIGGSVQRGHTFELAVGTMAHEFAHSLGLPDLHDVVYAGPEDDSAGIGYWGLMGHGARGWDERGGPTPFSAWSLAELGWLGVDNENLVVVDDALADVEIDPVHGGGKVYQLPTRDPNRYFLAAHRDPQASFYDRHLPMGGLLVWHVRSLQGRNGREERKKVDVVCADGLFEDAGFPRGQVPAPIDGRDNLDFWAHDSDYRSAHEGNLGDSTDLFDGDRFTELSILTNPAMPVGLSITSIRRRGTQMVAGFNVDDRRRFGALAADAIWEDEVEVVGDFSIPAGVRLVIEPGTAVRFGPDSTSGGQDPQRAGLTVVGELSVGAIGSRSVRFASAAAEPQPGDWLGIFLHPRGSVDLHNVVIEHAVYGLASRGVRLPQRLQQVQVHGVAGFGVDLQGVTGTVDLDGVEVVAADSGGVRLSGPGVVRMRDVRIVASGGSGIERTGGRLELSDSELLDNGVTKETAANLVLGAGTQGLVSGNGFRGGIGIWCSGSGAVLLQDNLLTGHRLGLVSSDARPQVAGNRFVDNELALLIEGDTVPQRLQLNVVEGSGQLVESRSTVEVSAANNWWGGVDEDEIESRITGNVRFRPVLGYNPRQPLRFALAQNHPNPFNGSTRIDYSIAITDALLAGDGEVRMSVYTVAGGHVRQLVRRPLEAGAFTVVWDGRDASGRRVASGVYLYRLTTGLRREARKLVLVR